MIRPEKVWPFGLSQHHLKLSKDGLDDCGVVSALGLVLMGTCNEAGYTASGREPTPYRLATIAEKMRDTLSAPKQTGGLFQEDAVTMIERYWGFHLIVRKETFTNVWTDLGLGYSWSVAGKAANISGSSVLKRTSGGHQILAIRLNKDKTKVAVRDPFRPTPKIEWIPKKEFRQFVMAIDGHRVWGLRVKIGQWQRHVLERERQEKRYAALKTRKQEQILELRGLMDGMEESHAAELAILNAKLEAHEDPDRFIAGYRAAQDDIIGIVGSLEPEE